MARKNKDIDVFRYIDMHGGDTSVCWEWLGDTKTHGKSGDERPYFTYKSKKWIAYRLVFNLFHPDEPLQEKEVIRHTCDISLCCNPTHLERGTHKENMKDMRDRARHGLSHHMVRAIRRMLANGLPQAEIALHSGVSRETISAIATGRIYKDVPLNEDEDQQDT